MRATTLVILASLCSLTAYADANTGGGGRSGACKADVEKLCPGIQPGGGRIMACLRQHRDEVSDACRANLQKVRARHQGGAGAGGVSTTGTDDDK